MTVHIAFGKAIYEKEAFSCKGEQKSMDDRVVCLLFFITGRILYGAFHCFYFIVL